MVDIESLLGQRVVVFRNPKNPPIWKIAQRGARGWKVVGYTDHIHLIDVRYVVHNLRDKYKRTTVHAWVEGTVSHLPGTVMAKQVGYKPKYKTFQYRKNSLPILTSSMVFLTETTVWAV